MVTELDSPFGNRMETQEEKTKLAKLLQDVEIPEVKLTERCSHLVKDFQEKFGKEVESEEQITKDELQLNENLCDNPYKVDKALLEDIDKKLQELLFERKRDKKGLSENIVLSECDPKRPWRTNSSKERLLRIENEIKRHRERESDLIAPLADREMRELVNECRTETINARPVSAERLRNTVEAAKKNLPNFQYRKVENSTATAILPEAHLEKDGTQRETED
ncbi:unnamed protein product [Diatraea saccharalis]|uniref:Uncharacterized protein n=1 Tax=Diatraea saccharalis TaxID=40085 RepID=A0A9N9MZ69_9NEOP|nr:unnamed protein product [Diatraea saccharalis]